MTNSWAVDSKDQGSTDSVSDNEGSSAEVQSNGNISSHHSSGDAKESDGDKGDMAGPEDQGSSNSSASNSEYKPVIDHEDIEKCKELSKIAKTQWDKKSELDYPIWEFCWFSPVLELMRLQHLSVQQLDYSSDVAFSDSDKCENT